MKSIKWQDCRVWMCLQGSFDGKKMQSWVEDAPRCQLICRWCCKSRSGTRNMWAIQLVVWRCIKPSGRCLGGWGFFFFKHPPISDGGVIPACCSTKATLETSCTCFIPVSCVQFQNTASTKKTKEIRLIHLPEASALAHICLVSVYTNWWSAVTAKIKWNVCPIRSQNKFIIRKKSKRKCLSESRVNSLQRHLSHSRTRLGK